MGNDALIVCFRDTLKRANSGMLKDKTIESQKSNRIYKEEFVSEVPIRNEHSSIIVEEGTTFATAKKYCNLGRVAVLNFANPESPGGGVSLGAMAQEECLCRSSNLYSCLSDVNVLEEYYVYHRNLKNYFYSDRLIYTKDVTVFKDDSDVPQLLPEQEWFTVDVITCAAPYLAKRKYTNSTALMLLFKKRIRNIIEAARDNCADVLILGAFGCGAFKNPADIVAEAFRQVIDEQKYLQCFKQIVFAIKPTGENCFNLGAFSMTFDLYAPDAGESCVILNPPIEWRFNRIPEFLDKSRLSANSNFYNWQRKNRYFGKQFSILGDSISTLTGYNPKGYNVFYSGDNCVKSGVSEMKDTWWDKVISFLGGEFLVNDSWSGSCVTRRPNQKDLFPSGCSDERTNALHIGKMMPDVIIVYIGTNDWAFGAMLGNDTHILGEDDNEFFDFAYDNMLQKLRKNYPHSEIWCCTLCETFIFNCPDFQFPHKYGGTHMEAYNNIIRNAVWRNKCKLIDLYSYKMPYDSIDGSHPTSEGMTTIATAIIREMVGDDADIFLNCENDQHGFEVTEEYTGGTKYVCKKCGKIKHESNQPLKECSDDVSESEYIILDSNITTMLYSNTLRLTIESTGKTVEFQKDIVNVGRESVNDFILAGRNYVARQQATFFYERKMWFLRDNDSTNGTWINGAKLQPGKKYQLAANDEINFAMSEKVIFYKHEQLVQQTGDTDVKAIAFLEAGMVTFAKSQNKDEVALKLIVAALSDAPLYFPVEIDIEAMLGNVEPTKLKQGDTLQPSKDVRMRILTLTLENDIEFIPMFTSNVEAKKGLSVSIMRYYPQDYLRMLVQMDKPVIINPFSEFRFLLNKQLITDVLLPIVQSKTSAPAATVKQDEQQDRYVGTVVGDKYSVLELIGRGGVYTTYLVMDVRLKKTWAMKVCDKKHGHYSPVVREVIFQETFMMKRLEHPAIPKVVDIVEDGESICIIRDYIEGETLETIVREYGARPADKVIEWSQQLCDVLRYLHSLNPSHIYRDMKPANVILKPNGTIKLVDFGIMRTYKPNQTGDTCCLGTIGYAAPEQFGGRQTDARTDIYGLGMTLHHLVTGVDPKKPSYEVKPICQINPSLPEGLEYIISKCIQLNPEDRYQSCDELMEDLNNYMNLPKQKGFFKKLFGKK